MLLDIDGLAVLGMDSTIVHEQKGQMDMASFPPQALWQRRNFDRREIYAQLRREQTGNSGC